MWAGRPGPAAPVVVRRVGTGLDSFLQRQPRRAHWLGRAHPPAAAAGARPTMHPMIRLSAFAASLLLGALLQPAVRAATDFSGETEFASSDPSKYPDTGNVVPYQPVRLLIPPPAGSSHPLQRERPLAAPAQRPSRSH